jgi:hypothetical protein
MHVVCEGASRTTDPEPAPPTGRLAGVAADDDDEEEEADAAAAAAEEASTEEVPKQERNVFTSLQRKEGAGGYGK